MAINLTNSSLGELHQIIADAKAMLEKRQREQRAEVVSKMRKLAATVGLDFEIVASGRGKKSRSSAVAKYRNPANAAQTWNGRGPKPKWFKEAIAKGKTVAQLAI